MVVVVNMKILFLVLQLCLILHQLLVMVVLVTIMIPGFTKQFLLETDVDGRHITGS